MKVNDIKKHRYVYQLPGLVGAIGYKYCVPQGDPLFISSDDTAEEPFMTRELLAHPNI